MKTLKIIVKGRVQKVGYRSIIDEIAYSLGIAGYVKNLEDKRRVEIVAQHKDEKTLNKFIELIKIKSYSISVDEIKTEELSNSAFYDDFNVVRASLDMENNESLEAAVVYMRDISGEMKATREELSNKQDTTIKKLEEFNQNTQQQFQHLDGKYHKVSEKLAVLGDINSNLKELVDILRTFKPK